MFMIVKLMFIMMFIMLKNVSQSSQLERTYRVKLKFDGERLISGTVCDGAYQATDFEATLEKLCCQENAGEFFTVLWDPPHYIDLALKDVFEGKTGSSNEFFQRLVKRSSVVHQMFQRGKMLSHAKEMASNDDDLVLRLTSRSCCTRFSASQYVEFRKLIDSLPLYIKTFRAFKFKDRTRLLEKTFYWTSAASVTS